jgi:acetolactate synthase-1/3 small subunit
MRESETLWRVQSAICISSSIVNTEIRDPSDDYWVAMTKSVKRKVSRIEERMLHTFIALVQDKPGVLTRVASLFRRLNINIVSLTVGESERSDTSRMTIVCEAPEHAAHRIKASLYKLEITVDVDEVSRSEAVIRELCLIKVAAGPNSPVGLTSRSQIFELANVFRARVVDLAPESIMLEMTGSSSKIEGLVQVVTESGYTILEVSRTGRMAMRRGHHTSRVLEALGTPTAASDLLPTLSAAERLPNEFDEFGEDET